MINGNKWENRIFIASMIGWPVIHWLIFVLYMNIQTISYSFQRFNKFIGIMQFVGFDNYVDLYDMILNNTEGYAIAFRNTLLWLMLNVFAIIPIALVVAYFLSKRIPLSRFYNTVFFIPNIISIVILTMIWAFMWSPDQGVINGLLDLTGLSQFKRVWLGDYKTALPVIFVYCVWAGIGWNNLILGGAISKIPKEIFEAAQIDGVSNIQEFFYIVIPSVWSTIVTVAIIGAAAAFRVFLHPQLLTNGQYDTASVALKLVESVVTTGDYGLASATGITLTIIGFIIVYIIRHYMDKLDNHWS